MFTLHGVAAIKVDEVTFRITLAQKPHIYRHVFSVNIIEGNVSFKVRRKDKK